jgi:hypothetical protein
LRRLALPLSFASLTLIAVLSISCGGSSNTIGTSCTGGPYNVVGNWQLTVTDTGGSPLTMYGAIDSSGLALFFDNSQPTSFGDTAQLPTLTGTCSFSGDVTAYAEPGGPNSGMTAADPTTGNVTSNTALSGSFTGDGVSGTYSGAAFTPLTGSIAAVTGEKTGEVQGAINNQPILLPLTFSPTGTGAGMSFTTNSVTSPNCTVTGTYTQEGTNNVFDVSITFTPAGTTPNCALTGTYTGLGFESSADYFNINGGNADTYLYADILASTNTFVMEIF